MLPKSLREQLAEQIEKAREVWRMDREEGLAGVYLPGALARKYRRAAESFEWFWLFPARQTSIDPETRGYADATPERLSGVGAGGNARDDGGGARRQSTTVAARTKPESGIRRRHHLHGKV